MSANQRPTDTQRSLGAPGDASPTAPQLVLHIDRLVLRGVAAQDAAALVAALRQALTAELADPAASAAWMQPGHSPGWRLRLTGRGESGAALGLQVARQLAQRGPS